MPLPLAITMGDPAGIGPEIIARLFCDAPLDMRGCLVAGDEAILRRAAGIVAAGSVSLPLARIASPADAWQVPPRCIPLLQALPTQALAPFGRISAEAGRAAADCVVWAAQAALRREVAALVTAPLHKEALAAAGVSYPGHTELLQAQAAAFYGQTADQMPVRMMLANDELRVVLVSVHLALRQAIEAVTVEGLLQTLHIADRALTPLLGRRPRIAVAGLNPHAGEGGLFGTEEQQLIQPALATGRAQGLDVHGPYAPDTVFMRARARPGRLAEFDVVIAMYHDQGLIPVKYLGIEQGVNVTLGLPLVRTGPDHGTAFDLAGTGRADSASLLAAVRMARRLVAREISEAAPLT